MTFDQGVGAVTSVAIGIGLLVHAFAPDTRKVAARISIYAAVAMIFGSLYFYLYSRDPTQFVLTEEVRTASEVKGNARSKELIAGLLEQLNKLDSITIALAKSPPEAKEVT